MNKLLKLLKLLIFGYTSFFINASAFASISKTIVCDDCDTSASYKIAAQYGAAGVPDASVHVLNTKGEILRRFSVIKYRSRITGDFGPYVVSEIAVETEKEILFRDLVRHKKEINDFFDYSVDIPSSVAESAYDLPGAGYLASDVANYYLENQTLRMAIGNYTATALAIAGKVINLNLVIELNFSDGTIGFFKITGLDSSGTILLEFKSGLDADSNTINAHPIALSGSYRFTVGGLAALNHFNRALERMGISVVRDGGSGSGGGVFELRCDSKHTICRLVKVG